MLVHALAFCLLVFAVPPAGAKPPTDRAEVVRQVYAAFNARDKGKLRTLIAEDVRWYGNGSDGVGGRGPMRGIETFLTNAFGYVPNFKSWTVTPVAVLTDGKIVMTRQRDDVVRADGSSSTYLFNNYYEFNDNNQIQAVWELSSSAEPFH